MRISLNLTSTGAYPAAPASTDIDHPKIKAAIVAYEQALAAERKLKHDRDRLEHELELAQRRDLEALADAQAAKRKDPGPVFDEKARKDIADTERRWGAAGVLVERCRTAVNEAFEEHGDEFEHNLRAKLSGLADVSDELLTAWTRNFEAMSQVARVLQRGEQHNRLTGAPSAWVPRLHTIQVNSLTGHAGVSAAPGDVVEQLRGLGKPPAPRPETVANPHRIGASYTTPPAPEPPKRDDLLVAPDGTPFVMPDDFNDQADG